MSCNKQKYDKKSAISALNHCKKHRNKQYRKECRYYFCDECNSYHLTSEEEHSERMYLKEEDLIFKSRWEYLMDKNNKTL